MTLSWIQKWFKPCEDTAPLKQEIACLKMHLAESRLKGTDTTFVFDGKSIKTIKANDLYKILDTTFSAVQQIRLADTIYQYTSLKEVQRWASFDPTSEIPYRSEVMDCDKFALTDMADFKKENNYQLGNSALGLCWGVSEHGYHAWNLSLVYEAENLYIAFLEPQTDLIFHCKDTTVHDYQPDFIYI